MDIVKHIRKAGVDKLADQGRAVKLRQKIEGFTLFDDELMSRVFDENIECTELVLRIILKRTDIRVTQVHTQREIKNLRGHSVRLDIHAETTEEEPVDIEIQRADKGAGVKRARYNASMMDANTLVKGEEYDRLPECYCIFITEKDVMGCGLPVYHAQRVVSETGKLLGDGTHIIYVNGAYRGDDPVGRLMHDFSCSSPWDMYYQPLARQVGYYKNDEKGVEAMSKGMEELIDMEKKEIALKMLEDGKLQKEEVARYFGFTMDQVEELSESLAVQV